MPQSAVKRRKAGLFELSFPLQVLAQHDGGLSCRAWEAELAPRLRGTMSFKTP